VRIVECPKAADVQRELVYHRSRVAVLPGLSMTLRPPTRATAYQALSVGGAVALPVLFYLAGYPSLGAVLMLSGVLVLVVAIVGSGALSPCWRQRESSRTIGSATRYELAKALVCAGLAVNAVIAIRRIPSPHFTIFVILIVAGLLVIVAGLFLTRWFAGYLLSKRRRCWPSGRRVKTSRPLKASLESPTRGRGRPLDPFAPTPGSFRT
jgi:hypothetical protein